MDECQDATSCSANALCTDTEGAYGCECLEGFRGDAFSECSNIDECAETSGLCHQHGTCIDTIGGYNCTCKDGYAGNGTFCEGSCSILFRTRVYATRIISCIMYILQAVSRSKEAFAHHLIILLYD